VAYQTDENGNLVAELGGFPEPPRHTVLKMLGQMPGTLQSAGATSFRGSNTILRGGWAGQNEIAGGAFRNNNLLRPRTWSQYGSQDIFFEGAPSKYKFGAHAGKYTPFAAGAGMINWGARKKLLGTTLEKWATADAEQQTIGRVAGSLFGGTAQTGAIKGKVIGSGALSQISAAERAGSFARPRGLLRKTVGMDEKMQSSVSQYLTKAGVEHSAADLADPMVARTLMYRSMQGPLGQYAGGYLSALKDPLTGHWANMPGAEREMGTLFTRGARASTRALSDLGGFSSEQIAGKITMREGIAGIRGAVAKGAERAAAEGLEGLAAKRVALGAGAEVATALGASTATTAIPIVGEIMWALTALDIGKMVATGIVPGMAHMALDAAKSYTGSANLKMFGGGYTTNEAAVTSRQRGVMAIQNSRLNARSILGSEAGSMASYYG
jgi:hypothetical protein